MITKGNDTKVQNEVIAQTITDETAKNIYKTNEVMKNIEQLLYKCPVCGAEFENMSFQFFLCVLIFIDQMTIFIMFLYSTIVQ